MNLEKAYEKIKQEQLEAERLRKKVLELITKGFKQKGISDVLGVKESVVSRLKNGHKFRPDTVRNYLSKLK